jgi:signal transduction histidine kinase/ActR/RegA family two-component response regulator
VDESIRHQTIGAFAIALAAVGAATGARYLLTPVIGSSGLPFIFYFPAIAIVGLTGHLGAALFATLLSALVGSYLFVAPMLQLTGPITPGHISLVAFLLTAGTIAVMTARLERALNESAERARIAADRTQALERERANLQRESRRLSLLADVSNVGLAKPTFKDVANHAARRVAEEIGDACIIRVFEGDELLPVAWRHVSPEAMPYLEAMLKAPVDALQNTYYARLRETRRTVVIDDQRTAEIRHPLPPDLDALQKKHGGRQAALSPILYGDSLFGTLTVFRAQNTRYSDNEIVALEAVASRIALTLDNARLMENARREAEDARQARAVAEEASRVKDEFLATLSHELRTPLNAIVGWAHMLRDPGLPEDRRRAAVETIVRNAQSQEQLISDILEVQRIMAGKLRLELRSVDLGAIVRAAAETVQPSAEAKHVKLQLLLDLNVTPIWGDPDRLQQITWNLLSNAIKFTPSRGRVQVRVQQSETECEMIVEDNGPGIAADFLPYVFDRFRQADASSTRTHKGLGLGLAIVKNLVEMHGGSIEASNSSEPGKSGAVFTLRFPRHTAARVPAAHGFDLGAAMADGPAWLGQGLSLRDLRVLVVDDDGDARELIGTILERYGADAMTVPSVEEGMHALAEWQPHVVVTDIEMPLEDGYTFIRRIRALSPEAGGRVPAAALTAYASAADRMRVLAAGFNMHVAKPVQPAELAMIVASLAGKHVEQTPQTTE